MPELTDFLLDRIAEDEEAAKACGGSRWRYQLWNGEDRVIDVDDQEVVAVFDLDMDAMHAARWNPTRVLAECEAKRRIVALDLGFDEGLARVIQLLANVYADHPDYDETWRVE